MATKATEIVISGALPRGALFEATTEDIRPQVTARHGAGRGLFDCEASLGGYFAASLPVTDNGLAYTKALGEAIDATKVIYRSVEGIHTAIESRFVIALSITIRVRPISQVVDQ